MRSGCFLEGLALPQRGGRAAGQGPRQGMRWWSTAGFSFSPFFPLKMSFMPQSAALKARASHLCPSLGAWSSHWVSPGVTSSHLTPPGFVTQGARSQSQMISGDCKKHLCSRPPTLAPSGSPHPCPPSILLVCPGAKPPQPAPCGDTGTEVLRGLHTL